MKLPVFEKLTKREYFSMDLGLDRIKACLKELNNPQNQYKTIHIAGTNGKGSTAAMIARSLQEAGYKTGLTTSPHLISANERIRINEKTISNKEFDKIYSKLLPLFDKHKLTLFEAITTIAFVYFAEQKVDIAVIEVGMGGRLDATNVINPKISIITDIGIDHTKHLGNTIKKIAFEKAGIIKENAAVVVAKDNAGIDAIENIAKKENAKITYATLSKIFEKEISLNGNFQKRNASLAVTALKKLKISNKNIILGLKNTIWPGRMQEINGILIDGAHNTLGIKTLSRELQKTKEYKIIITSMLKDKEYKKMIKSISQVADELIITKITVTKRAATPLELKKALSKLKIQVHTTNSLKTALKKAKQIKSKLKEKNINSKIIICGSLYLAGEALNELGYKKW